jgi:hypothetical protein
MQKAKAVALGVLLSVGPIACGEGATSNKSGLGGNIGFEHDPIDFDPVEEIRGIAAASECANARWSDRGRAPRGYIEGMALTYARSLCRLREGDSAARRMAARASSDESRDALSWYEGHFERNDMDVDRSGPEALRALYTLGIGLGMRESSGKYCEGYDTTAGAQSASTAEAGLFQTSYNSHSSAPELPELIEAYEDNPESCWTGVFRQGVSCRHQSIIGSGSGAAFQRLAKSCPAFAAEYAMITLRVLRRHYGPINRRAAQVLPACGRMLEDVEDRVKSAASFVCDELL